MKNISLVVGLFFTICSIFFVTVVNAQGMFNAGYDNAPTGAAPAATSNLFINGTYKPTNTGLLNSSAQSSGVNQSARSSILSSCSRISSTGIGGLVECFIGFLNDSVYVIISLTVIVILIGGFNMISSEEKRESGRQTLVYGVIGLAVMVSIWGLVNIVISTFGISGGPISPPPLLKQ